jgi:hypothetical protein
MRYSKILARNFLGCRILVLSDVHDVFWSVGCSELVEEILLFLKLLALSGFVLLENVVRALLVQDPWAEAWVPPLV